jgi:hypothetical protein
MPWDNIRAAQRRQIIKAANAVSQTGGGWDESGNAGAMHAALDSARQNPSLTGAQRRQAQAAFTILNNNTP